VSADCLPLLRVPVLRGRGFEPRDMRTDSRVAIVNESTARAYWPGRDPIGKIVKFGGDPAPIVVIGVAKDIRYTSLSLVDSAFLSLPAAGAGLLRADILVRGAAGHAAISGTIREQVRAIDPGVLVQTSRLEDNPELYKLPARITANAAF